MNRATRHPNKPPRVMNGCRVRYYSLMPRTVGYSGKISIHIGGKEIGRVPRLSIGDSLREKGLYLLHCDKNWNVISAGPLHNSVANAKRQAELMYPGVKNTWVKVTVSMREARKIERKMWTGFECSFCGKLPPDFQRSRHGKRAVICNICVEKTYHDFVEMQEEDSVRPLRGDYYPENGLDYLGEYISRLLVPTNSNKFMRIYAIDRMRGCGLIAYGTMVQVSFILKGQPTTREEEIRTFFSSKGKTPSRDYLTDDKRIRILQYPVSGSAADLTALTRKILQEFCDIKPQEAFTINFTEHEENSS